MLPLSVATETPRRPACVDDQRLQLRIVLLLLKLADQLQQRFGLGIHLCLAVDPDHSSTSAVLNREHTTTSAPTPGRTPSHEQQGSSRNPGPAGSLGMKQVSGCG